MYRHSSSPQPQEQSQSSSARPRRLPKASENQKLLPIHNRVFVGGLDETINEEDLRQLFGTFGVVQEVLIKQRGDHASHRGHGFVTFKETKQAEAALVAGAGEKLSVRSINLVVNPAWRRLPVNTSPRFRAASGLSPANANMYNSSVTNGLFYQQSPFPINYGMVDNYGYRNPCTNYPQWVPSYQQYFNSYAPQYANTSMPGQSNPGQIQNENGELCACCTCPACSRTGGSAMSDNSIYDMPSLAGGNSFSGTSGTSFQERLPSTPISRGESRIPNRIPAMPSIHVDGDELITNYGSNSRQYSLPNIMGQINHSDAGENQLLTGASPAGAVNSLVNSTTSSVPWRLFSESDNRNSPKKDQYQRLSENGSQNSSKRDHDEKNSETDRRTSFKKDEALMSSEKGRKDSIGEETYRYSCQKKSL